MLIRSLLILSLTSQTSALAADFSPDYSVWGKEFVLAEGDVVPNAGVLVPEGNYRDYQRALSIAIIVSPKLYGDVGIIPVPECQPQEKILDKVQNRGMWLLFGSLLGLGLSTGLRR